MGKLSFANLGKTVRYLKKNGIGNTYYQALERLGRKEEYAFTPIDAEQEKRQREESTGKTLLFSIVVPCYETPEVFLRQLIDSVLAQTYGKWELLLADASSSPCVKEVVERFDDARIRYLKLEENGGISRNTNATLPLAKGDYICLLDHDDLLTSDALFRMEEAISGCEKMPDLVYSDEDKTDATGSCFYEPHIKYKFNYDLILSNNYICHFSAIKATWMKKLGLRPEFDGAQDYDLMLRLAAENAVFVHVPYVLYHWRCHELSTAANTDSKGYAYEAGKRALEAHYQERGIAASVSHSLHLGFYNTCYQGAVWEQRPEIGAVCGKVFDRHGKMLPSVKGEDGSYLYVGLRRQFSGPMHRFSLAQEVAQFDLRAVKLRPELKTLTQTLWGIPYPGKDGGDILDADALLKAYEAKYPDCTASLEALSRELSDAVKQQGYLILFWPTFEEKG